jgi:hypothetical protein
MSVPSDLKEVWALMYSLITKQDCNIAKRLEKLLLYNPVLAFAKKRLKHFSA